MGSGLEEIERREAAERERIEELWARIAELSESPVEREVVRSLLEITRQTMSEIPSGDGTVAEPDLTPAAGGPEEASAGEAEGRFKWVRRSG
jgi:hypothetical protein